MPRHARRGVAESPSGRALEGSGEGARRASGLRTSLATALSTRGATTRIAWPSQSRVAGGGGVAPPALHRCRRRPACPAMSTGIQRTERQNAARPSQFSSTLGAVSVVPAPRHRRSRVGSAWAPRDGLVEARSPRCLGSGLVRFSGSSNPAAFRRHGPSSKGQRRALSSKHAGICELLHAVPRASQLR
jgi:hypothetical protein